MLKAISVTFDIDPKDFALLLAHAGRMRINTVETPVAAVTPTPLLTHKRKKKQKSKPRRKYGTKAKLRAYVTEHKQISVAQAVKDLRLPKQQVFNAVSNLVHDKFITRVGRGAYSLVGGNAHA